MSEVQHPSRTKLLDAAQHVLRAKGYAATTVDNVCARAGVTKGSFFHHFKGKEDLVRGAIEHWNEWARTLFGDAPYHEARDPRDRLLAYVDFRIAILDREPPVLSCLLGTLVQEIYATHPLLREACDEGLSLHIESLTEDIQAAKELYAPEATWTVESVGYFIQAVIQGSYIFAKARQSPVVARENLMHLQRYLEVLFPKPHAGALGASRGIEGCNT